MIKLKRIKEKEIVPGFFGKFCHGDKMTLAFWEVKKGSSIPEHNHVHEQILFVQSGKFELALEGEKITVKKNELIVIPSNKNHSGIALSDCKLIDVFTPKREEYNN